MIELRWRREVLQYRNLLSDEAKLGIQTRADADIAAEYERWKDVPTVLENVDDPN